MLILKTVVSAKGEAFAMDQIAAGKVNKSSDWSFTDDDSDALLGDDADWSSYSNWFLGSEPGADPETKAYHTYPTGKDGVVHRSALVEARSQAAQNDDGAIFGAAGRLMDAIDGGKSYSGAKALPMRQQAWSKFDLKAMTETDTHYELSGIATTPTPDRMQDIVEPMGCDYEVPIPLLWQHDSDQPVGEVFDAKPGPKGIPVQFRIPKFSIPGLLKDRLDLAIQSITLKLVRGLSIGFAPVEYSYMEETGGYRFIKWLWLELSCVTIPANAEATIDVIKSMDIRKATPVVRLSRKSLMVTTSAPEARRKHQDWCDTSSESVDEILAERERMLR
jgi:HK97 family phage prohead protease